MRKAKTQRRNHFFFRHCLKSNKVRDVEVYSGPVQVEGRDLLFSVVHDITDQKRAETAMKRTEQEKNQEIKHLEREKEDLERWAREDGLYHA